MTLYVHKFFSAWNKSQRNGNLFKLQTRVQVTCEFWVFLKITSPLYMCGNIGKHPYQQSWTKQQNILISDACWWIYHLVVKRSCQEHTAVATSAIRLLNWKASFQPKWCNEVIKCNICFFLFFRFLKIWGKCSTEKDSYSTKSLHKSFAWWFHHLWQIVN